MKFRYFIFSVFLGGALISCGSEQKQQQTEDPSYPVMNVMSKDAELLSTFAVNIKGEKDIEIKPRVDGTISQVLVSEGQPVSKGQPLFSINAPSSEQGYRTAKASVTSAEAQLQTAQINVNRLKPLADEGIISKVQYETTQNSYNVALAGLEQAKAALYNAEEVRNWATVTSPVDGVVNNIPYRLGSLVTSSTTLTTIANTQAVYVYFSMDETYLMNFLQDLEGTTTLEKIDQIPPITLILKDGTVYPEKGKVRAIDGIVNSVTGAVTLRADFPNPNKLLKSGYSGTVNIPRYLKNVIVIPQEATYKIQNKTFAYKFSSDSSTVKSTIIEVIPTPNGQEYVVTGGLKDGETIVSSGLATLKDGMKIKGEK